VPSLRISFANNRFGGRKVDENRPDLARVCEAAAVKTQQSAWGTTPSLQPPRVTKVSTARRLAARIARLHVVAFPLPPSGGFFLRAAICSYPSRARNNACFSGGNPLNRRSGEPWQALSVAQGRS
jgi:hypothetical protein